jgi:hypothetical protein
MCLNRKTLLWKSDVLSKTPNIEMAKQLWVVSHQNDVIIFEPLSFHPANDGFGANLIT